MDTHPSSSTLLSAEFARFESYILEIAREAKGAGTLASDGPYRFGAKQGLCVYLNGQFHDFSGGPRPHGHGALELVQHLYPNEDPITWAIAWLAQHPGNGAFIPGEGEPGDDFNEVEATAYINALYNGAALIDDTPGYDYIVRPRTDDSPTTRGLPLLPEDQAKLRWVANYRGEEGLLVFPVTDDESKLVKLLGVHVTLEAGKSTHTPARITILGARRRGLLRFGTPGPTVIEVEGPEKGLAARAAGSSYVVVCGGVSNLGKISLPPVVRSVVIARDADPAGSLADQALWCGAVRRLSQGLKSAVTARPNDIAPKDALPLKDIDDVWRYDPELASILLNGANLEHGRLGEANDNAILDLSSRLDAVALGRARKGIAQLLGIPLGALDDELERRVRDRIAAQRAGGSASPLEGPEPHPDPVTDIGEVLDAAIGAMRQHVAAPDTHFYTAALWCLHAHLIHKAELDIDITSRLGFQSPEWNSGKTTFMDTVGELVPRPLKAGSISGSAMFRAISATKCSLLCDEIEFLLHADSSPEVKAIVNSGTNRAFAFVLRSMPVGDGQFELQAFSTFAAVCFTAIGKLDPPSVQSRCISLPMRPATEEEAKKLKRFRPKHARVLKECGRKFARWAADLTELPEVDLPERFVNRIADNWRVLFQISHLAGDPWPARVLAAAEADAMGDSEDASPRGANGLLDAIWRVFADETTADRRLPTHDLIGKLVLLDDGYWGVVDRGRPLSPVYLRTKLKGYVVTEGKWKGVDIPARQWKLEGSRENKRGYHELHFADSFLRYLGRGLPSATPAAGGKDKKKPKDGGDAERGSDGLTPIPSLYYPLPSSSGTTGLEGIPVAGSISCAENPTSLVPGARHAGPGTTAEEAAEGKGRSHISRVWHPVPRHPRDPDNREQCEDLNGLGPMVPDERGGGQYREGMEPGMGPLPRAPRGRSVNRGDK